MNISFKMFVLSKTTVFLPSSMNILLPLLSFSSITGNGLDTGVSFLIGTSFVPVLEALYADKETKAVLVVGQVHGILEQELADFYKKKHPKKLFVYIPGKSLARSDKAPLLGMKSVLFSDIIEEKKKCLLGAKAIWIDSPDKIGKTILDTLKGKEK